MFSFHYKEKRYFKLFNKIIENNCLNQLDGRRTYFDFPGFHVSNTGQRHTADSYDEENHSGCDKCC